MSITRREFFRSGIGLSGILLSGKAPAYVRSLLGGRNIRISDSKWANPYVTDGLLAMYDGEWNAGPFQHDPNTMPIDLTGKGFLNLSFEGDIEMMEQSVWFHSESYAIDRTLQKLDPYDAITIEYVSYLSQSAVSNGTTGTFGWVYFGTGYSYSRRVCGIFAGGNGLPNYFHLGTYDDGQYWFISKGINSYALISDLSDGTIPAKPYKNGEYKAPGTKRTTTNKNKNPTAAFALRRLNNNLCTYESEMYALRVYGRALSAEEIAYNYAVDRERFNLP